MSAYETMPWSATDEDESDALDASTAAAMDAPDAAPPNHAPAATSPVEADEATGGSDAGRPGRSAISRPTDYLRLPGISPRWTFVPLGLSLAWAGAGVVRAVQAGSVVVPWAALLGALAATVVVLWLGLTAQRRHIDWLMRALRQGGAAAAGPSGRELEPLQQELLAHLDRLADSIQQSHDRGVDLGHRLAANELRWLRTLLDALPDGLLALDASDRIELVNPAAAALLGIDPESALHASLPDVMNGSGLAQNIAAARRQTVGARTTIEHEQDGRTLAVTLARIASGQAAPRAAGEGSAGSASDLLVAVVRDATREKQAARVTGEFVSHVAHELRTPLSSLKAYVEMLTDGEVQDEQTRRSYYDIIEVETNRLSRLIDNILNISRIESGTVRVTREPMALAMVVREAVDVMRPQAERKRIELRDELVPVMHEVRGDRDMIYEALLNLVSNAIKYTPEGGKVNVRMSIDENAHSVTTAVSDTGLGIPAEDLPRMFEKFFRVKANAKAAKGTGLGLNLVRNIVETVHGGKVAVASEAGRGSTFSITLPLLETETMR